MPSAWQLVVCTWNADLLLYRTFHCRADVRRTQHYGKSLPLRQESEAEVSLCSSAMIELGVHDRDNIACPPAPTHRGSS